MDNLMVNEQGRKLGVVLMNLGTPDAPTASSVRSFLREFLGDPRVVELPRALWYPILYGFILPFRPGRVAKLYQQVWRDEGSPLKVITRQQVDALRQRFDPDQVTVTYAMTYGQPNLAQRVAELQASGCAAILVLPLYPQYSATTTAPIFDQYADLIREQRDIIPLTIHKHYYQMPAYLDALASSVRDFWREHPQPQKLLFSFHGIPQRCVDKGDPYEKHCHYTAQQVAERLQLNKEQWSISFQSRLGKAKWLQPYTDQVLQQWGEQGVDSVQVICPAFAADCLETIEEIDAENREIFLSAGGRTFGLIPCLNNNKSHIDMMQQIVERYRNGPL